MPNKPESGGLRGGPRGDFSRFTFDPQKRYSAVRMQQGRVQLDADWNELVDILAHRLRSQALDMVGEAGAPAGGSGFQILPRASLEFSGEGQYVSLGKAPVPLYAAAPALTVEIEVRPAEGCAGGTVLSRFDRAAGEDSIKHTYLLDLLRDGGVRFILARAGGEGLEGGRRLALGRWGRLALVHDAESCRLFVDGEAAGHLPAGLAPGGGDDGALFLLGAAQLRGERLAFDGAMRELRIWDRALTAAELGRDPAAEGRAARGLIGHWSFDQVRDHVAPDLSGAGNHAYLGGGRPEARPAVVLDDLLLGAGRYWLGGLLCENPETVAFARQPDQPGAEPPARRDPGSAYLFYLDAWETSVSAAQDPDLREPALGGPDTAVRSRIVTQARWLPLDLDRMPEDPGWLPPEWRRLRRRQTKAALRVRRPARAPGALENRLYRLEVHTGGGLLGWPRPPDGVEPVYRVEHFLASGAVSEVVLEEDAVAGVALGRGDWVELSSTETDRRQVAGMLARVHSADAAERTLTLARPERSGDGQPAGGADDDLSLEGFEGHRDLALRRVATFKWSRDNGSVELPIAHLGEGGRIATLKAGGPAEPAVTEGDWVELVDDRSALGGAPSSLLQVAGVEAASRTVTLHRSPSGAAGRDGELHPLLRRWDQSASSGEDLVDGLIAAVAGRWHRLEHGIEVCFDGAGTLAAGDFWSFAARRHSGEIVWPKDVAGEPLAVEPHGVEHSLSPLALLRFSEDSFELRDCRPVFQPLSTGAVSKAGDRMHGRLEIRADPEAGPALDATGSIRADTLLGSLGTPGAVTTANLADRAVSRSKIAADCGTVGAGYSILGEVPEPPAGYTYTGCPLEVPNPRPEWVPRAQLRLHEEPGELHSAAVDGRVYTFSQTGRVWRYDAVSHELSERRAMPEARRRFAVAAAEGKVYVFGGLDINGEKLGTTLEYSPEADAWSAGADLPTPRSDVAVAIAGGRIHVLGGLRDLLFFEVVSRRNEVYDPRIDAWDRRAKLPSARFALSAAAGPKGIFIFGGERRWFLRWLGRGLSGVGEEYLPGVDRWVRRGALLPAPQSRGGTATIGDKIYLVGGRSLFGWTAETAEFNPESDIWEPARSLPVPAVSPGVAAVDGRLIVHTVGSDPESLLVQECTIFTTFYVHRKSPAPPGDIEPRLRMEEGRVTTLEPPELED